MTGEEIKKEIEKCNAEISKQLTPEFFTLNKKVNEAMVRITQLQHECPHEFVNGICKWCNREEN